MIEHRRFRCQRIDGPPGQMDPGPSILGWIDPPVLLFMSAERTSICNYGGRVNLVLVACDHHRPLGAEHYNI